MRSSSPAFLSALTQRSSAGSRQRSRALRSRCSASIAARRADGAYGSRAARGVKHEVALADLDFSPGSELAVVVAAYRRWQGRSPATRSALAVASDVEKATVLDELVGTDHELQVRAERVTRSRLSDVEIDDAADAVAAALLAPDQEDLAAKAGRTRHGYVEVIEAAWSLLAAAVEPWVRDIARRARLGLLDAPRRLGLGIFDALERVGQHRGTRGLRAHPQRRPGISWAPYFADETAGRVTQVLADAGIVPIYEESAVEPSGTRLPRLLARYWRTMRSKMA
jgi:hypothetical protein